MAEVLGLGVAFYNSGWFFAEVLALHWSMFGCFPGDSSRSFRHFGFGTSVVMVDPTMIDQNLDLKEKLTCVLDRAKQDAIALLLSHRESEKPPVEPIPEWMTASQLARYWQLVNSNGEPTTAGIMKWARRPEDEHPLPHAYMGDLLRFNRIEVYSWAREEAERRRAQNEQRRLRIA
jgi:hypothetical protein